MSDTPTPRNEGAPDGALAWAPDGGCEARTSVTGRYPEPAADATMRLVVYTTVDIDVFGRRHVRAVALPLPRTVEPAETIEHRGTTWTREPAMERAMRGLAAA